MHIFIHAQPRGLAALPERAGSGGWVAETDAGLDLSAKGCAALGVPMPEDKTIRVRIWRSEVDATPAGPAADAWLSDFLNRDVRLVWLDDPTRRPADPQFSGPDDRVGFADGYPLLMTATGSLAQLNAWMGKEIPMTRFRPNIVVETEEPFAEDAWLGRRLVFGMNLVPDTIGPVAVGDEVTAL